MLQWEWRKGKGLGWWVRKRVSTATSGAWVLRRKAGEVGTPPGALSQSRAEGVPGQSRLYPPTYPSCTLRVDLATSGHSLQGQDKTRAEISRKGLLCV